MTRRSLLGMLLIGILLASCGGQPAAAEATPDMNLTVAAGAQTMVAAVFQTQTAIAPPATNTAPPTVTSLPTVTASTPLTLPTAAATQAILFAASPTPTGTFYTSTPLSSSLAVGCSNMALVREVTIPSGTQMRPGQAFTKTWQVANTGTCDWLYGYSLVFGSGERMSGNGYRLSSKMNVPVRINDWRQISVELVAPNSPGTYTASWRVANGEGQAFGASLPVSIEVKRNPDPTATPNVLQTAAAGTVAVQLTQTAAAQQTANSIGLTAIAGTQTAQAAATATPTATTAPPTATPTPTNTP